MDHATRCKVSLLALVLLAVPAAGQDKAPKQAPPAATPEEAVRNALRAAKAGDVAGFIGVMADPNRSFMQLMANSVQLQERVNAALDQKFGKDKNSSPPPRLRQALRATQDIRIVKKDPRGKDCVDLTVWETLKGPKGEEAIHEAKWTAVKRGDGWKLLVPLRPGPPRKATRKGPDGKEVDVLVVPGKPEDMPPAAEIAAMRKAMPKIRTAIQKLIRDVHEGKYKTRADAVKAWQAAMKELRDQAETKPEKK